MKTLFRLLAFLSVLLPLAQAQIGIPLTGSIGVQGGASVLGASAIVMTDADYTLAPTQYTKTLIVTSSGSLTATRNIIAPLNPGQEFSVINKTTGGQSIVLKGASGTGATVSNGALLTVTSDGTNYYTAAAASGGASIGTGATAPTSTCSASVNANGLYVNTTTNHVYLCNSTAWVDLSAILSVTSVSATGNITTAGSLFAQLLGSSEYRADSFPSSCTISGVTYTSNLDCALATAASVANTSWNPVVKLGTGSYSMKTAFVQPTINGGGISIVGNGMGNTTINVTTQNSGSPWAAAISRGQASSNWGSFQLKDFTLNCAPSGVVNALYGLNLTEIRGDGMILQNIAINNCGDNTLGGEDILIGGTTTDPVGFHILNVTTDYHENVYVPVGQTGTYHPPATGIEFGNNSGDSIVENMIVRNASVCPVKVDATGTGDIVMKHIHPFGYGVFGSGSVYTNYASAYSFCDYAMSFSGAYDHYIEPYADSPTVAAFDIGTHHIKIDSPTLYLPSGPTWTTSLLKLEPITAATYEQIYVSNPACFNAPFYNTGSGLLINNSTNPVSLPIITGGFGCAQQADSAVSGGYEVAGPMHLNYNPGGATTPTLDIGNHTYGNAFINFAYGRMFVGHQNYVGPMIGPTVQYCSALGTSAATTYCYAAIQSSFFHFGSNNNSPLTYPNFSLDSLGVIGSIYSSIAAATTIAPTAAIVQITGAGTISTITPPAGSCTMSGISCNLRLISIAGFSLATGGNVNSNMTVPAGQYVELIYQPNTSLWTVPSGANAPGKVATAALTGQTAALSAVTLYTPTVSGTYRVSMDAYVSTAATAGTITPTITTNAGAGGANVSFTSSALSANVNGAMVQQTVTVHVGAGQAITYSTPFTGVSGSPVYGMDAVVEKLQ